MSGANMLLIREMLSRGCEVTFFSKSSFVDPRPLFQSSERFSFVETDNQLVDRIRSATSKIPVIGQLTTMWDASSYNRLIVKMINHAHQTQRFDAVLWFGDYARGQVDGVPALSFAQGPPGTDARAALSHYGSIRRIAGWIVATKWALLARLRLSPLGLPPLQFSDKILVGSHQSRNTLISTFGIDADRVCSMPYPIDLDLFHPRTTGSPTRSLRCLWLGRIIPRKNLPLLLEGAALAIQRGADIQLSVIGQVSAIKGYERLLHQFPYPERLRWTPHVARQDVPAIVRDQDIVVQPSEEEDFGSSVAEAQASGLPVVIGKTNGNADYLCERDIHLADYDVESLASALTEMAARKRDGKLGDSATSRSCAEKFFSKDRIADQFIQTVSQMVESHQARPASVQSPAHR